MDPALTSLLEQIYRLLRNAFIRYIVECSETEIRGDFDRRVFAAYDAWERETQRARDAVREMLEEEDVIPTEGAYALDVAQFNYLSPTYLLARVIAEGQEEIDRIEALAFELGAWPRAQSLVCNCVAHLRLHLDRARRLEAQKPVVEPKPRKVKGTSASRW
jgi:hypothetical protein